MYATVYRAELMAETHPLHQPPKGMTVGQPVALKRMAKSEVAKEKKIKQVWMRLWPEWDLMWLCQSEFWLYDLCTFCPSNVAGVHIVHFSYMQRQAKMEMRMCDPNFVNHPNIVKVRDRKGIEDNLSVET